MSTVTMNMSGYEIERDTTRTDIGEDNCADWRIEAAIQQYSDSNKRMPIDLIAVDVDTFMSRMYAHQR
jgi:hypothetical protein